MSNCANCGSEKQPITELQDDFKTRRKCIDCNAFIADDVPTIPAAPPPPSLNNTNIVALAKQRLAEVEQKLSQYDALIGEKEILQKMLGAIGE